MSAELQCRSLADGAVEARPSTSHINSRSLLLLVVFAHSAVACARNNFHNQERLPAAALSGLCPHDPRRPNANTSSQVLNTADADKKAHLAHAVWRRFACGDLNVGSAVPDDRPARPRKPEVTRITAPCCPWTWIWHASGTPLVV